VYSGASVFMGSKCIQELVYSGVPSVGYSRASVFMCSICVFMGSICVFMGSKCIHGF